MPSMHVRRRRLLAIGLGAAALAAAAGCGGSEATPSGDSGSSQGPYYQPQAYDQSYGGDPAAELETQRQAVEALNNITQLQYDAGMSAAGNFTP